MTFFADTVFLPAKVFLGGTPTLAFVVVDLTADGLVVEGFLVAASLELTYADACGIAGICTTHVDTSTKIDFGAPLERRARA